MHILVLLICVNFSYAWVVPLQNGAIEQISTKNKDPRVINGNSASPEQFPWQVRLDVYTDVTYWTCTGSIISDEWILSAAHCYDDSIIVLHLNIRADVTNIIPHENYDRKSLANDIAVLNIETFESRRIAWKNLIARQPRDALFTAIPLASNPLDAGTEVTVIGWGDAGDGSSSLHYANLITIENSQCDPIYGEGTILDDMVCSISENDILQTPCFGDAGGPLVTDALQNPVQVGVVSFFGDMGCYQGYPSVYIRVATYRDWINAKTGV